MDKQLIERLAREAGACNVGDVTVERCDETVCFYPEQLRAFVLLVAEDCAKRCDAESAEAGFRDNFGFASGAAECARLIRSKFKEPQ